MVNLGSVWDRATEFLSEKRAQVLPVAGLGIFVPLAAFGVLTPLAGAQNTPGDWGVALVLIVLAAVTIAGNLALTALVIDPAIGGRAAWRLAGAGVPVAIAVSLAGFALSATTLLPVYAAFVMGGGSAVTAPAFGAALFILLYILLLGVVGLVAGARLMLFYPALIAEPIGIGALLRSVRLTRGMTIRLVGVLLLYIIVSQVAGMAARTVSGVLFGFLLGGDGPLSAARVLTAIVVAAVQTGFSVIATAFIARLFVAVRDQRETILELS